MRFTPLKACRISLSGSATYRGARAPALKATFRPPRLARRAGRLSCATDSPSRRLGRRRLPTDLGTESRWSLPTRPVRMPEVVQRAPVSPPSSSINTGSNPQGRPERLGAQRSATDRGHLSFGGCEGPHCRMLHGPRTLLGGPPVKSPARLELSKRRAFDFEFLLRP